LRRRCEGTVTTVDLCYSLDLYSSCPPQQQECADLFGLPYTGVIDRPDLQEILIDECQKIKPDFIVNGNPVTGYESLGKGQGVTVNLMDGEKAKADVLVGSDGIWSAIRAQMYNEGGVKSSSDNRKTRQGCPYSGYTVFAGETVLKTNDYYDTGYKVRSSSALLFRILFFVFVFQRLTLILYPNKRSTLVPSGIS